MSTAGVPHEYSFAYSAFDPVWCTYLNFFSNAIQTSDKTSIRWNILFYIFIYVLFLVFFLAFFFITEKNVNFLPLTKNIWIMDVCRNCYYPEYFVYDAKKNFSKRQNTIRFEICSYYMFSMKHSFISFSKSILTISNLWIKIRLTSFCGTLCDCILHRHINGVYRRI